MTLFILKLIIQNSLDLMLLLGGILGIGFILGTVESLANRLAYQAFGKRGILFTAWLGTPVHELSHFLLCFIFHHKVEQIKLLQLKSTDGTLGYVIHRFNPASLYQRAGNFFIGIAPIFGGIAAIFCLLEFFAPSSFKACLLIIQHTMNQPHFARSYIVEAPQTIGQLIPLLFTWNNMSHLSFWLFVYCAVCIASHISLSPADIKGAVSGVSSLFVLLLLINGLIAFFHINGLNLAFVFRKWNLYLAGAAGLALLFSVGHLLLMFAALSVKRLFFIKKTGSNDSRRYF